MKPYEVEILVAEVGATPTTTTEMFHILYDGTVMDEQDYAVLGGQAEQITEALEAQYQPTAWSLGDAVEARRARCSAPTATPLAADQLEVALLDRAAPAPRVPPHQGRRARRDCSR